MLQLAKEFLFAFCACIAFTITFNAPKKELLYCGLTGALGWSVYACILPFGPFQVLATFAAAITVSYCARWLSRLRKAPSTLYLIPGVLPLVPGAGMYYTMVGILNSDMTYSYYKGVETMKLAGVIAIGIIIVFSFPVFFFPIAKKERS